MQSRYVLTALVEAVDTPYNLSFKNTENNTDIKDENLLATTLILLHLTSCDGQQILWNNKIPQSSQFCRPKKFQFVNETIDIILTEEQALENEINNFKHMRLY